MISPAVPDRSVWRNGPFVRLWVAQAISQTAQNALWYALLVVVEDLSHSTTQLGVTILSVIVPAILFGVPAGVYVDRWDKRTVLVVTNLARALIAAVYLAVERLREPDALMGAAPVALILLLVYVVSFAFSVVSQFFAPAELAMIPALVGRQKLMAANSLFHLTFTASQLLGLVFLGPLLVKVMGTGTFFGVAAGLYAVCGVLVWALPPQLPPREAREQRRHALRQLLSDLREVSALLRVDQVMLWAMGYWTVGVTLTLMVAMLAPRFVVDVLGIAAADTVFVVAPGFVGTLAAAVLLSRSPAGSWSDRHQLISRGLLVVGAALALVSGVPAIARGFGLLRAESQAVDMLTEWDLAVVVGVMLTTLVGGFGFTAVMIGAQTALQERTPPEARGRVFGVQLTLASLVSVIPLMGVGGVADLVGVGRALLILGAAVGFIAALGRRFGPGEPARVP